MLGGGATIGFGGGIGGGVVTTPLEGGAEALRLVRKRLLGGGAPGGKETRRLGSTIGPGGCLPTNRRRGRIGGVGEGIHGSHMGPGGCLPRRRRTGRSLGVSPVACPRPRRRLRVALRRAAMAAYWARDLGGCGAFGREAPSSASLAGWRRVAVLLR